MKGRKQAGLEVSSWNEKYQSPAVKVRETVGQGGIGLPILLCCKE